MVFSALLVNYFFSLVISIRNYGKRTRKLNLPAKCLLEVIFKLRGLGPLSFYPVAVFCSECGALNYKSRFLKKYDSDYWLNPTHSSRWNLFFRVETHDQQL